MEKCDLRPVNLMDSQLLFRWVNFNDSLKWKQRTSKKISKFEHDAWLLARLSDPLCRIWIIVYDGKAAGQVRLERKNDLVYTDIYVVAAARGVGVASYALNEAIKRYTELFGKKKFCAIMHPNNEMSEKLFLKNGFQRFKTETDDWLKYLRLVG